MAALVLSLSGTLFASTEIVFWHFFGIGDAGEPWVIQEWVDRFNASQNEYVVVPQNQPWGPGMYEKLVLATAADTVPDVIVVHDWAMPNLARIGVLAQLQDNQLSALGIDPSDFFPLAWDLGLVDGKIHAIPFDIHPDTVFYNRDILAEVGIAEPQDTFSLEDLREIGRKVNRDVNDDGILDRIGNAMPWVGATVQANWLATLKQFGGQLFDESGQVAFDSDAGYQALEAWVDLIRTEAFVDPGEGWRTFEEGRAATTVFASAGIGRFSPLVNLGVTPFYQIGPEKGAKAASHMLAIPSGSRSDEQLMGALKFINFISENTLLWATEAGHIPVRRSIVQSGEFQRLSLHMRAAEALDYMVTLPTMPEFLSEIDPVIQQGLLRAFHLEESVQAVIENMATQVRAILGQ